MSDDSNLRQMLDEHGATNTSHPHRNYPYNDFEDDSWEWFDELEERFPEEIKCDFIEVSPNITKYNARAYYRENGRYTYIRFSKHYVENYTDKELKETLLHEMVHLYTYQKGYFNISDGSHLFKWLCGSVGAKINQVGKHEEKWRDLARPLVEDKK